MIIDKKILLRHHGFSLVEVMIALLIFMVIMLGLAKGEISALLTQSGNSYRDEALRIAEDELNRLKSLQFSIVDTDNALNQAAWTAPFIVNTNMRGGSIQFTRSVQITDIASTTTALKRIDVAVGWTQGNSAILLIETNRNHQTSLSTIIVQSD